LVEEPGHEPTLIQTLQSGKIQTFYSVSQDKKTGLITIESVGKDPEFCAKMVNNVIRELNSFLENEYDSNAKREREFIEKQLEKATTELERWERQVPNDSLTLSKITREQLVAQTVYTEMRKQLELVKITEAKELETFTILDKAFIPEYHFKPKKRLIVMLSFVCSGFVALFLVFFHNFVQNVRKKELAE
jgi:uncharacterized protein involved in exopolysaccharide biosynthesis